VADEWGLDEAVASAVQKRVAEAKKREGAYLTYSTAFTDGTDRTLLRESLRLTLVAYRQYCW
jgi:hypothetical protein